MVQYAPPDQPGKHRKLTSDLRKWLASRKLDTLEAVLVENEIDFDVLFDLTDEDLREIGLSLGARKRLRAAIEAARGDGDPAAAAEARQAGEAERRQLTTMFVDLVGSTALSGRLDPEDMREVIAGYQNAVARVVTRYDGQVAKYMGDGILCYFGWPRAHEDDAKRAARSGLDIVEVLRDIRAPTGEDLSVRIGVATGLVVVGDVIGDGAAQEEAVVGDTPNLAARLQSMARAGEVVVAETTRQLLGNEFETTDLGEIELRGIDPPVSAWRVDAERSLESRFDSHALDPVLPMFGRDHELALIMERWNRACAGEGQVTVLIGESGIGKSRLTRAVVDEVGQRDHYRIGYHCSPYHTDSSFHPLIRQLTHAMGFADADGVEQKLDKLETNLRAADPRILAELLQIDGAARYGPLELTPQQLRNRIMEETSDEVRALAREHPVLIVVEDAHWIDASTLAVLEACLDKIVDERAMILITARPTFAHGFGGHPIVGRLTLNRLGSDQTAAVLSEITGGKRLPDDLVAEIIARTDGVPLFIEELTKTIIESGELRETDTAYELTGPIGRVTIPATLHDSLMARIDRLQPIKEIAQMAACIGRRFSRAVLAEIARIDDRSLDDALARLERSELIFRRGTPSDTSYVFKHALVRDVAYESLLKKRRQELHRDLVDILEADPTSPPELIAHHATAAGLSEKAVLLWGEAGSAAQARPAYDEAANHLRTALSLVTRLLDRPDWREKELSFLVQLAQVYIAKEGYASKEASGAFAKALERVDATKSAELRVAIYYGTWIAPYIGNQLRKGLVLANRLVEDMAAESDPIPRLMSRRMRAANLVAMGQSRAALEDLRAAYDLYRSAKIADFSAKFAQDPGVQIWCYMQLALWLSGRRDEALDIADRALARARDLKHANTSCYAGLHDVTLSIWAGDVARARTVNEEMRTVANDHDMSLWKIFVGIHDAVVDCMADARGAPAKLDAVLDQYKANGGGLWITLYLAEQAKALLRAGDPSAAAGSVRRAMAELERSGERWAEAELHRIVGDVRLFEGDRASAERAYETAIAVAKSQDARSLEQRAARSLDLLRNT
jgi:class 3 adenylate cyclase/tetratricopeptide (TPR) repeat protein